MTAPIDTALVRVAPDFREFTNKVKADVHSTVTAASTELNGISRSAEKVGRDTEGAFAKSFNGIKDRTKDFVKYAVGSFAAIATVEGVKGIIEAGREAQKTLAQTAAVLKSTGGAANVTAEDVENLAKKISSYSGIEDDAVKSTENLLLTFTNIKNQVGAGNDIFNQATVAVTDMSVALKEDAKSAAIQLGKALNDPIKGITALQRVGVSFTQQQRDQIKALVDSGHTLDAQKIILGELTREFGGSAAAQATAGDKMRAKWQLIREELGLKLIPIIDRAENALGGFINGVTGDVETMSQSTRPKLELLGLGIRGLFSALRGEGVTSTGFIGGMEQVGVTLRAVYDDVQVLVKQGIDLLRSAWTITSKILTDVVLPALKSVGDFIESHGTLVRTLVVGLAGAVLAWKAYTTAVLIATKAQAAFNLITDANPILLIVSAIAALAAGFIYAYTHSQKFRDTVDHVIDNLQHALGNVEHAVDNVRHAWDNLWHAGENVVHAFDNVWHAVGNVLHAFDNVAHAFDNTVHAGENVVHFFTSLPRYFEDAGTAIVNFFIDLPKNVLKLLYQAPQLLIQAGVDMIKGLVWGLVTNFKLAVAFFETVPEMILRFFIDAPKWLFDAGMWILRGLWDGLKFQWDVIVAFFKTVPQFILSVFINANVWLFNAGTWVLRGLWDGIVLQWDVIAAFFRNVPKWILSIFIGANVWLLKAGAAIISGLWAGVISTWNAYPGRWFGSVGHWIIAIFAGSGSWLVGAGSALIGGLWRGISAAWGGVADWFTSALPNFFWGKKGIAAQAGGWLVNGGKNVIYGFWNGVKAVWNSVAGWFKDLPGHILDLLGIHSPPDWAIDAGKWIMKGMLHGLLHGAGRIGTFVADLAKSIAGGFVPGGPHSGGQLVGNANAFYQYAKDQMVIYGWDPNNGPNWPALFSLWQGESNWNPLAKNPESGAYGIPQSLPADKMASAGPNWMTDAATQIRWGLKYIKDAYGSPANAYSQWLSRSPHWYHEGAWRIPSDQLAWLKRGEMVTPVDQAQRFRDAVQQARPTTASGGDLDYDKLAAALARAFVGLGIQFDGDGLARLVTRRQSANSAKGARR